MMKIKIDISNTQPIALPCPWCFGRGYLLAMQRVILPGGKSHSAYPYEITFTDKELK